MSDAQIALSVKGMMCRHCQASVRKALEAVPGVDSAEVDLEKARAVVACSAAVRPEDLVKAVAAEGFEAAPE